MLTSSPTQTGGKRESPLSAFLSLTSYILHHAYRSSRATLYGLLNLLILRLIVEDLVLCKFLCDPERLFPVRLCRQRQPFLPPTPKPRPGAAALLDILVDTINHNLRRNLDLQLYVPVVSLIHRVLSYLNFHTHEIELPLVTFMADTVFFPAIPDQVMHLVSQCRILISPTLSGRS